MELTPNIIIEEEEEEEEGGVYQFTDQYDKRDTTPYTPTNGNNMKIFYTYTSEQEGSLLGWILHWKRQS